MKKRLLLLSAAIAMTAVLAPGKSEAIVGIYLAKKSMAVTGGVMAGVGTATAVAIIGDVPAVVAVVQPVYIALFGWAGPGGVVLTSIASPIAAVVGVVLLDEEGSGKIQYKEINHEQGLNIGLTAEEISSFNGDVDMINTLQSQIEREADSVKDFNAEKAAVMWNNGLNALNISQETRIALVKITAHALKDAQVVNK